jgi:hypothetical protein
VTDEDGLFDWHTPIRKSNKPEYLGQIAGTYGGHPLWELAPVDRYVREKHIGTRLDESRPNASEVDFVWLIVGRRPVWALVNIYTHEVIALDPDPIEKSVREALTR